MTPWLVMATALAGPLEAVLQEVEPLRELRLATDAPDIPAGAYEKASEGKPASGVEMVDDVKAGKGWGVMVYDLPIEAVWRAVNDEQRHAGRLPVSHSAVIRGTPNHTGRLLYEYMPLPVVRDRWWIVEVVHNAELYARSGGKVWEMSWTDATDTAHLDGTDFLDQVDRAVAVEWTLGSWMLIDLGDDRTLCEYFTWTDPGGTLPAGPASRFAGGALKDTLRAMGDLAAEHPEGDGDGFVRPDQTPL